MEFLTAYEVTDKSVMDRYHVRFNTGDEWIMSENADSAQGLCYYAGVFFWTTPAGAFEIDYEELPEGIKAAIKNLERTHDE